MFNKQSHPLPAAVEAEIISRLFNALPQIGFVTTCFVAGTIFIAWETGDAWTWAILGVAIATSVARIAGILAYRRWAPKPMTLEQARRWERAYSLPALAFTVGIALLTVRVFAAGWTNGEILAVGLTMALTAGSCARTLRYWLCATLSTIALTVLIVMLLLSADPVRIGIAALFALYLFSIFESSRHIVGQVEALLIAERELEAAARRDPLTGLANRRAFDEALAEASATGGFALLLLDLDGFKAVNDRLGHAAGDELLHQVAARLSGMLRTGDMLARLGGDEFAAILPTADTAAVKAIADRAVALVGLPYAVLGAPAIVGISIGFEVVEIGHAVDGQQVKEAADRALYSAKAAGKGQAVFARAA
ncbi:GGDEF domain-containing protein [Bosea sp. FBZP-16]|jgi:diguanylate cyclase (GGDEF)-like protein|uniref:GGDEF domain-containing protein n=1 Tax=Bosea sp. FBZP-16 TaxID=2065382 RepID=UPI000C311729|nr:GGDEF domain-containing protein [Bosea sp. FBZP-16]